MNPKTFYLVWIFVMLFISASLLWMFRVDSFTGYATEIFYRDKEMEKKLGDILEDELASKNIVTLNLIGNEKYDKNTLDQFRLQIQKAKTAHDFNKVVHLKFHQKTNYEELICAFQICKIEDASAYIPDGYDLWVVPMVKKRIKKKHSSMPK